MLTDAPRRLAVALAGFCAFLNLYSPQALLPAWTHEFGVGAVEISMIMTGGTLAVALMAPFSGVVADVLGRKHVIVAAMAVLALPTVMIALAPDVEWMIAGRFLQGLVLPPIFAVAVAYIGEEWPPDAIPGVAGLYTSGASLGGFAGRFLTGTLTDLIGWRGAFLTLAVLSLCGCAAVALMLPRERAFVRSANLMTSLRQMLGHLRNPRLVATYAIGFGVLFNFIATFTYITFVLAAPPFSLSPSLLGAIFVTYLFGTFLTPWVGRVVNRVGRRIFVLGVILVWIGGVCLTLVQWLPAILAGLTLCAGSGLLCQATSTGYVTANATTARSSAVGLYVTSFYIGGSVGAYVTGYAYEAGGWPACVALMIAVLLGMALVVAFAWERDSAAAA